MFLRELRGAPGDVRREAPTMDLHSLDARLSDVTGIAQYPPRQFLRELPFGPQLADLAFDRRYEKENRHVKQVLVNANTILARNPSSVVTDPGSGLQQSLDTLRMDLNRWAIGECIEPDPLLRVAALYHDIGKWIVRERHPTEGYFLLMYLFPPQNDRLADLVGDRKIHELLLSLIRDHDKFGILSTGEASLPVIADLLNPALKATRCYQVAIVALMLLNLADMADSAAGGLGPLQTSFVVEDTQLLLRHLEHTGGSWAEFTESLVAEEAQPGRVTGRIARLVDTAYKIAERMQRDRAQQWQKRRRKPPDDLSYTYDAAYWAPIPFPRIVNEVDKQLRVFLIGGAYSRFCEDLAHFCKFDYGLYFFGEMARQFHLASIAAGRREFPLGDFVAALVEIIKSIIDTYREFGERRDSMVPRVGVQMQALRRNANITETITGLLAQLPPNAPKYAHEAISWITHEVSVWLFI